MCKNRGICEAVCRACKHFTSADGKPVPIIGAANTLMETVCAEMNIPFIQEFIADLEYDPDGNCIITRTHDSPDVEGVHTRLHQLLRSGTVPSKDGAHTIDLKLTSSPLSLCVHSDTPNAVDVVAVTREAVDIFNKEYCS